MDTKILISAKKWKIMAAALQATGTLDIVEAHQYLTHPDVQEIAQDKKGARKGNPLYHTTKKPNNLVLFIELFESERDLCLAVNDVIRGLYDEVGYEAAVPLDLWLGEFLNVKTIGRSVTAMKAGGPLKALQKIITDYIEFETSDTTAVITRLPEKKVAYSFPGDGSKIEPAFFHDSFEALTSRNYWELDPVSGDASCEMRVPFLLDVQDVISLNPDLPEGEQKEAIDGLCPFSEIETSKGSIIRSASRYFGLCKPLTILRTQAKDHFQFLIDDRPTKYKYSFKLREAIKADLASYNVDYMRWLAKGYADSVQVQDADLTMESMISTMLDSCQIEMSKGGYKQPILPVFTAMRLILMHEIKRERPIAVALSRIGYLEKGDVKGFQSCGSKVFYYKVNSDKTGYVHVGEDELTLEDKTRPITVFHAYNMLPLLEDIEPQEENDGFFFSRDWDTFEAGFVKCDITHLLRCWAAAHPPVPKSSKLWVGDDELSQQPEIPVVVTGKKVALNSDNRWVVTDEDIELSSFTIELESDEYDEMRGVRIREYIEEMQIRACPQHHEMKRRYRMPDFELSGMGTSMFGLTEQDMDLASEYQYYKELAERNDLYELHYAADIGDETVECFLDRDGGLEPASRDDYNSNTSSKYKLPSQSVSHVTFMRTFGAAAFSPVHVFLSSYNDEVEQLTHIGDDIWDAQMSLSFIETDDGKTEGATEWDIREYKLDPDLFS